MDLVIVLIPTSVGVTAPLLYKWCNWCFYLINLANGQVKTSVNQCQRKVSKIHWIIPLPLHLIFGLALSSVTWKRRKSQTTKYENTFIFLFLGGMWEYSTDTSIKSPARLVKSLVINSSTIRTCFSDFPFPAEAAPFVQHKQYYTYLLVRFKISICYI